MSNEVQFDIDTEPRAEIQTRTPAMVKLVIKLSRGLVKDEKQANYVLLGFVIVAFTISFLLYYRATEDVSTAGMPLLIVPSRL